MLHLVGFSGFPGRIVVDASNDYEASIVAFREFAISRSKVCIEAREDAWNYVCEGLPPRRKGEAGTVLFIRANPAPVD